jgi:hypothetical protein
MHPKGLAQLEKYGHYSRSSVLRCAEFLGNGCN